MATAKLNHNGQFVKTKLCRFEILGACTKGLMCPYAHDAQELKALPDLRGTKLCKQYVSTGMCNIKACTYAHSKSELRHALERLSWSAAIECTPQPLAPGAVGRQRGPSHEPARKTFKMPAEAWQPQPQTQPQPQPQPPQPQPRLRSVLAPLSPQSLSGQDVGSVRVGELWNLVSGTSQEKYDGVTGLTEKNYDSGLFAVGWPPGLQGLQGLKTNPFASTLFGFETWTQASNDEPAYVPMGPGAKAQSPPEELERLRGIWDTLESDQNKNVAWNP